MICEICVWMLRGRRGRQFEDTLDLKFVHHDSAESFWASVAQNCSICRALGDKVGANFFAALRRMASAHKQAFFDLRSDACLSAAPLASDGQVPVYRLDFVVKWAGVEFRHTFVLRPAGFQENIASPLRTPISDHMYDAEVLGLAKSWLHKCNCVRERVLKQKDYPTRLISLAEFKTPSKIDAKNLIYHEDLGLGGAGNTTVNIVDTNDLDWSQLKDKAYVTLSHSWGGKDKPIRTRLTRGTEKAYRTGVRLRDLPRTFRDAIHFALRVDDRVHYIWIDSLCIIQDDEEDWLKESGRMREVYRNSFLNISATAARDSGEGLYSYRVPKELWEEVVFLDIDGLDQLAVTRRQYNQEQNSTTRHRGPEITATAGPTVDPEYLHLAKIQSCLLVDVSNWETLVNEAPVNKRGWVIQERLLAPRVLHFCRGRIAWECAEFEDIEGQVPRIPNYRLIGGDIHESIPVKGLQPGKHGRRLRLNRLRGVVDPLDLNEDGPENSLALWSRIVEMYCKTDLTKEHDKLIALSGLAQRMADIIAESGIGRDQIRYVAGLWNVHLTAQLPWHVEPVYRGDHDPRSDMIEYSSRRPKTYRAPSFSWASVDAQYGNGLTYGHVPDLEDILVETPQTQDDNGSGQETKEWKQSVWVSSETGNEFGVVRSGHIRLWAWVHHVKLQREGTHYFWLLLVNNESATKPGTYKDYKKNFTVYLDCPSDDDKESELINSDEIYCIPITYGSFSSSNDLICLLLVKASNDYQILAWPDEYRQRTFKRIGYTKLSAEYDSFTWDYISNFRPDSKRSDEFYDELSGRSLVCII